MLEKLDTIYLYKGASSTVEFDFTEFNFDEDSYCEFMMINPCTDEVLKVVKFNKSEKYIYIFEDEFTKDLNNKYYQYNIMYFTGGERYPECADSDIIVEEVINNYDED